MADVPQSLVLERHRDLHSIAYNRPIRWALLALLTAFILLGLANVFGQRPDTLWLRTPAATLELYAPSHVRGGLLWEARFTITAHRDLKSAALSFSPGWNEGMQQNTIEPNPVGYGSRDGDLLLTLGHVAAGHVYRLFMQFQTNATNVGRRRADVTLYDGATKLGTIHRTVTVFP
ncbi:MAG: hypothetical protein ACRDNM_09500 [Gaiellaceae bacterium]